MILNDNKGGKLKMCKPTMVEDDTKPHSAYAPNVAKDIFTDCNGLYVYI